MSDRAFAGFCFGFRVVIVWYIWLFVFSVCASSSVLKVGCLWTVWGIVAKFYSSTGYESCFSILGVVYSCRAADLALYFSWAMRNFLACSCFCFIVSLTFLSTLDCRFSRVNLIYKLRLNSDSYLFSKFWRWIKGDFAEGFGILGGLLCCACWGWAGLSSAAAASKIL